MSSPVRIVVPSLCALLLAACATAPPAAPAAAPPIPTSETSAEAPPRSDAPNNDCWWFELDGDELVAVWLSPRLQGHVPGGFRFVNVVYHDPRAARPILMRSTPVACASSAPVVKSTGVFPSRVAPLPGRTWAQVVSRDDLVVRR